jgi:hypothetical protein
VPVRAVAYLEHRPGRIFSTYLWNDYLDFKGRRVFVDGRTELYTDNGVLQRYLAVDHLTTDPDPVLRASNVQFVLWPTGDTLARYLGHDRNWAMLWHSALVTVFERVAPAR